MTPRGAREARRSSSRRRCSPPPRSCASSTRRSCATRSRSCAASCRLRAERRLAALERSSPRCRRDHRLCSASSPAGSRAGGAGARPDADLADDRDRPRRLARSARRDRHRRDAPRPVDPRSAVAIASRSYGVVRRCVAGRSRARRRVSTERVDRRRRASPSQQSATHRDRDRRASAEPSRSPTSRRSLDAMLAVIDRRRSSRRPRSARSAVSTRGRFAEPRNG